MSIFNKIFGNSDEEKATPDFWNYIKSEADLEQAVRESPEFRISKSLYFPSQMFTN